MFQSISQTWNQTDTIGWGYFHIRSLSKMDRSGY